MRIVKGSRLAAADEGDKLGFAGRVQKAIERIDGDQARAIQRPPHCPKLAAYPEPLKKLNFAASARLADFVVHANTLRITSNGNTFGVVTDAGEQIAVDAKLRTFILSRRRGLPQNQ